MSDIRLYVDEDASEHAVVDGLRARGLDIVTTADAGQLGATDVEQLWYGISQARTLYSFNVGDFARLHAEFLATGTDHAGIVVIPDQRYSIGEKMRALAGLMTAVSAKQVLNRMVYLQAIELLIHDSAARLAGFGICSGHFEISASKTLSRGLFRAAGGQNKMAVP